MNSLVTGEFGILHQTQAIRNQLMDVLNDTDLAYRFPNCPSLGELCREMGETEQAYIESYKTFKLKFQYGGSDAALATNITRLKERMGWELIPWYTITGEWDTDHDVREWHGTNAFLRDEDDRIFRTYFIDGRGDEQKVWVVSGFTDLTVFKSTGSEFKGFLKDRYTTLQETDDRILATSLTVSWRHEGTAPQPGTDWEASYQRTRKTLLAAFATTYSRALQETLYAMGQAVLESDPGIAEIKFSAPNKHHFLVDLDPFGLKNGGEVFIAADRPYGLIQAVVSRDDASELGLAWQAVPAFA